MPSIERTAYPRFSPIITASELQQSFTPTDAEQEFAQANTRTSPHTFCFLALLKCFQRLHYFPSLKEIPTVIVDHLRSCLHFAWTCRWHTITNGISTATAPRFGTTWASKPSTGSRPAISQCRPSTERHR